MFGVVVAVLAVFGAEDGAVAGPAELVGEGYVFTEGPLWIPDKGWVFSDTAQDTIFSADGSEFMKPSRNSNGLALDTQGRLVVCQSAARRIARFEKDGSETVVADRFDGKRLNSTNDVVVRSDGVIFFTDPKPLRGVEDLELDVGGVYAVGADGAVKLLVDDFLYPNGIGFSPDEKTLYVSDTRGGHIRAFDLAADGSVSNGRVHCEVRIPDGMTVDPSGRIWSSSSRGIMVFDADGTQVGQVDFRGTPTNCALGGPDGKTLLITARKMVYRAEIR